MKVKTVLVVMVVSLMLLGMIAVLPASQAQADDLAILKFGTLIGVPKTLTGAQAPIRNLNGGGLPWVIAGADGKLTTSGKLSLEVTGLVLDPNDPGVIASGNAGKNPIPNFRAVVSCLTATGAVANVMTDPFPATTGLATQGGGDAQVTAFLTLPHPCIAPIIFVTSPTGSWFATTGN